MEVCSAACREGQGIISFQVQPSTNDSGRQWINTLAPSSTMAVVVVGVFEIQVRILAHLPDFPIWTISSSQRGNLLNHTPFVVLLYWLSFLPCVIPLPVFPEPSILANMSLWSTSGGTQIKIIDNGMCFFTFKMDIHGN